MIFFSEENQGLTAMDPSLKRKRLDQDQSEMHQSKKRKVEPWTVEWAWNGVVNVIKSTLGYPTDENSDPNQNLPMVVEQAPPVTPTRSPFRTVIQRNGPPPKLQEMQTRRGEKEYKKFEAWMRSKYEKKSDSDEVEILEDQSSPQKGGLNAKLREFRLRQMEDLRKLSIAYEEKEKQVYEALLKQLPQEEAPFEAVPLTPAQEAEYVKLMKGPDLEVLVDKFNIEIRREDLKRLGPGQWLNDEVINFYISLLMEKSKKSDIPCHFMNTHFYALLTKTGFAYNRVAKWTKTVDIFSFCKIIIPVHVHGNHWCCAILNMKLKQFEYYDSLGDTNLPCIEILKRYIQEEHQTKKGKPIDITDWKVHSIGSKNPQQKNVHDCGVFMLKFAEFLSQNRILGFSQKNMELFRKQITLQIVHANLELNPK